MRHRVVPGDRGGNDGWGYRRDKARVDTEVVTLKDKEWRGESKCSVKDTRLIESNEFGGKCS